MCWKPVASTMKTLVDVDQLIKANRLVEARAMLDAARLNAGRYTGQRFDGVTLAEQILRRERELKQASISIHIPTKSTVF
jgi:hypothetical protein